VTRPEDEVICGDAFAVLDTLPAHFVQCVVTSPPYYRQRKYHGEQMIDWSLKSDCAHDFETVGEALVCRKCGGVKVAFGREPLLDCLAWARGEPPCNLCYVCHTRLLFQKLKRVLKKDGVVFYNLGDSYGVVRSKDLGLVPHRVALALQADGWYVRSDIIWAKRAYIASLENDVGNGMPESVADRPMDAQEHVLMLTQSQKYYYDWLGYAPEAKWAEVWSRRSREVKEPYQQNNPRQRWGLLKNEPRPEVPIRKRLCNVWQINTEMHEDAHFAIMPETLAEICIRLATSEVGECSACGKNWVRVVKPVLEVVASDKAEEGYQKNWEREESDVSALKTKVWKIYGGDEFVPQCECGAPSRPNVVLDPFAGVGTTLIVAARLGRAYLGIEICQEYVEIASRKLAHIQGKLL